MPNQTEPITPKPTAATCSMSFSFEKRSDAQRFATELKRLALPAKLSQIKYRATVTTTTDALQYAEYLKTFIYGTVTK